jgi:putative transposase
MPENCHILVNPRNEVYEMSRILKSIKSQAAKNIFKAEPALRPILAAHRPSRGTEYHVWQRGGGYDRNIFKTKTMWDVIRYVHENPVRKKICESISDWPWSSATGYDGRDAPIPIDLCTWYDDLAKPRNNNLW